MTYMLDTNICVYATHPKRPKYERVIQRIHQAGYQEICMSFLTLAELEYGAAKSKTPEKNRSAIRQLLILFEVLPLNTHAISIEYGKIRAYLEQQGMTIGPIDMLIAAHAKAENLTLVTHNVREFQRVPDLVIEDWADL